MGSPTQGFLSWLGRQVSRYGSGQWRDKASNILNKMVSSGLSFALNVAADAAVSAALGPAVIPIKFGRAAAGAIAEKLTPKKLFDDLADVVMAPAPPGAPSPRDNRAALAALVRKLADEQKKQFVLILIDDLDRCAPERALDLVDGLYQLLAPTDQLLDSQSESNYAGICCIWAINTEVIREWLLRRYPGMPSFQADAYLEKIFSRRYTQPPLTDTTEAVELWESRLDESRYAGLRSEISPYLKVETCEWLQNLVSYDALMNLRTYTAVIRTVLEIALAKTLFQTIIRDSTPPDGLLRVARLAVLLHAYPGVREHLILKQEHWAHLEVAINRAWDKRSFDWTTNPYLQTLADPSLIKVLADLEVVKFHTQQNRYELCNKVDDNQIAILREDLILLMRFGF